MESCPGERDLLLRRCWEGLVLSFLEIERMRLEVDQAEQMEHRLLKL